MSALLPGRSSPAALAWPLLGLALLGLALLAFGCTPTADSVAAPTGKPKGPIQGTPAPAVAPKLAPAEEAYVAVESWAPASAPERRVMAPKAADQTWRAYVHQYSPMQVKTPTWQTLPATENVHLVMPKGSHFACLVTPIKFEAEAEWNLEAWIASRELRCSGDGWQTWSSYPHYLRIAADGTRTNASRSTRAELRERRGVDGAEYKLALQLRDDEHRTKATTGPPKVIESKGQPAPAD